MSVTIPGGFHAGGVGGGDQSAEAAGLAAAGVQP